MNTKRMLLLALVMMASTNVSLEAAAARGLGVNLPVASRIQGSTLFVTSVDVTNNHSSDTQVDLYFDGVNVRTQAPVLVTASVTNGGFAAQGGGLLRARSNVHFEDLIDSLFQAGLIDPAALADGVSGSALFVFNNFTKSGQGSVTARIKNDFGGGSVGVAIRGRELTGNEPQRLVIALRDTRGNGKGESQIYPNLFINHIGLTPAGAAATDPITVEVSAVASSNGAAIGQPITVTIPSGRVAIIGSLFETLQVSRETDDTILVYARVTSGIAAIQGIARKSTSSRATAPPSK